MNSAIRDSCSLRKVQAADLSRRSSRGAGAIMLQPSKTPAAALSFVLVVLTTFTMKSAHADVTTNSGADYATECESKGVPLPPTWGTSSWKFNGEMGPNSNPLIENFIIPMRPALVYYAYTPQGLCMALPRPAGGTGTVPVGCLRSNLSGHERQRLLLGQWQDCALGRQQRRHGALATGGDGFQERSRFGRHVHRRSVFESTPHGWGLYRLSRWTKPVHRDARPSHVIGQRPDQPERHGQIQPDRSSWLAAEVDAGNTLDEVPPAPMEGSCLSCHIEASKARCLSSNRCLAAFVTPFSQGRDS